ncbi:MAG TPA: S8 family serine peptidase, partial [Solirubrobacterales bacterium]|nr:S8 family serine peptidase [Solirubrobacterales bacterium]
MGTRRRSAVVVAAAVALAIPSVATAAFPGSDPNESVRANAPNDPGFDRCEPDNEGGQECSNVFGEEYARFGFAPASAQNTATYHNLTDPHTQRLMAQNTLAGRTPAGQVSGVSADRAWKYSPGDPEVQVAILDTGIDWSRNSLRRRVHLNRGELPVPQHDRGAPVSDASAVPACSGFTDSYDANGDGAFNVLDYVCDSRVDPAAGAHGDPQLLDPEDLIATFSDSSDTDSNGYVDDIAGWDFFDDDNDPYDASSYSSANFHGSGRASDAAEEGNDAQGSIGVCPGCQIMPLRVWDTFVVDTNNYGEAVAYAADNGAEIVEGAVGGLFNSSFDREVFRYAYSKGTLPVLVSSDLNTADHNFPTDYAQALMVQGTVADVNGLGQDVSEPHLQQLLNALQVPTNAPVGTWFRNSGTTQYGGHAHIVMPATTGSEATGQASGAAGLLASYGLQRSHGGQLGGGPLKPNEIKQLLTMTAEDVVPENTVGSGTPDPSQTGWDQHFGYGRPDLGLAMERINQGKIPPQALITSPDWFAPLDVDQQSHVPIQADISADRAPLQNGKRYDWQLQWAPGIEPCESDFQTVASGSGSGELNGALGTINLQTVRAALDARHTTSSCDNTLGTVTGGSTPDPTAPAKGPGDVDPNEPAFTVRVVVTDTAGNRGEDRKVLFDYRDTSLHSGWSRPIGGQPDNTGTAATGGDQSQRMYDLNGDNKLDVVEADSSGGLRVLNANGSPLASFNNGQPERTATYPNVHPGAPVYSQLDPPREVLRTPAIGDIDGDREPEIVDAAGEHVYAWNADGTPVAGFPVRLDPSFSQPQDRTRQNHVKRGFAGSPVLADLDGDGKLEIIQSGLDDHLYAWHRDGTPVSGFPVHLRVGACDAAVPCAESINTPAAGDITGDGKPEIVVPTNENDPNPSAPGAPTDPGDFASQIRGAVINLLANAIGGSGRIYAVHADGSDHAGGPFLSGWPIHPNGAQPDALPFAGPGVDPVIGDVNGDGTAEAVTSLTTGTVNAIRGSGATAVGYDPQPGSGEAVDKSQTINFFENPIVANFDPSTSGLEVLKGGITLNQLVNVGIATGQNLPYNHVLQAWDGQTGEELPAFPQAVEDYQLLSSPAVADVSDASGPETIVGTGLYLLRDINAQGQEGAGWPKFTGGWINAVPAIGDVDGDGKLEVAVDTREGFSFLWDTNSPACGTNNQWWTSRHDEWSTGDHATDSRPPGSPENLRATRNASRDMTLSWKQPGDDWMCGRPDHYQVLASAHQIVHPSDGAVLDGSAASGGPGDEVTRTFSRQEIGNARHVAVIYRDDAGNWGFLRSATVPQAPGGSPGSGRCHNLIKGTARSDHLRGTRRSDRIKGRGGNDRIRGGRGADCINAG